MYFFSNSAANLFMSDFETTFPLNPTTDEKHKSILADISGINKFTKNLSYNIMGKNK